MDGKKRSRLQWKRAGRRREETTPNIQILSSLASTAKGHQRRETKISSLDVKHSSCASMTEPRAPSNEAIRRRKTERERQHSAISTSFQAAAAASVVRGADSRSILPCHHHSLLTSQIPVTLSSDGSLSQQYHNPSPTPAPLKAANILQPPISLGYNLHLLLVP